MSAKRYFWLLAITWVATSLAYPILVTLGLGVVTLLGCAQCGIMLAPLILIAPLAQVAFAIIAALLTRARIRETGLSGWWAIAAFLVPLFTRDSSVGAMLTTILTLPGGLAFGGLLAVFPLLSWAFLGAFFAVTGLYLPSTPERGERIAMLVFWLSCTWLVPQVPFNLPLGALALDRHLPPLLFMLWMWSLVLAKFAGTGALVYLLLARRNAAAQAPA